MSAGETVYQVLVCRRGYKARVPYVGRDRMVALTLAQAYIARGEEVELQETTEGNQNPNRRKNQKCRFAFC